MRPDQLSESSFSHYPPDAQKIAVEHVGLLRQLPMAFLPALLREVINYDWKFPAERQELDYQLNFLAKQKTDQLAALMVTFADVTVTEGLQALDWVNAPADFSEQFSAYLWATDQIGAFRKASTDYVQRLNLSRATTPPPVPRLAMVLVGSGTKFAREPLFRKLGPLGTHFVNVSAEGDLSAFFAMLGKRSESHPAKFAHWYIDGADLVQRNTEWACVSYNALRPVRKSLLQKMADAMQPGGGGPELLRSKLRRITPADVEFPLGDDPILSRFQLTLLTEGSGTQIFSTTFVQWTVRETLRRAQPWTLLARFTPRQRNQIIGDFEADQKQGLDPDGSLVDADMGAYYTWINQQRLQNSENASFVVWYEGHNQAVGVGPKFRAGAEETRNISTQEILSEIA
jgi:hypothetical protein